MKYHRALLGGATHFFTVNLADRGSRVLTERIDDLRDAVLAVRLVHPFEIVAWVVLPEHMHAVWSLPPGDSDYSMRWNQIKGGFSRHIPPGERVSKSRINKGERGIWQRRFWEHLIRDDDDLARHVDYVHYNPVKHGYVRQAIDWPFSSFHRFVERGWLPADWGAVTRLMAIMGSGVDGRGFALGGLLLGGSLGLLRRPNLRGPRTPNGFRFNGNARVHL